MRVALVGSALGSAAAPSGGLGAVVWTMAEALKQRDVDVEVINVEFGRESTPDPDSIAVGGSLGLLGGAAKVVGDRIDASNPDIVHVHGAPELFRPDGVPSVLTIHGIAYKNRWYEATGPAKLKAAVRFATYRRSLRWHRFQIAISEFTTRQLPTPTGGWTVIPNPVTPDAFEQVRAPTPGVVVCVGVVGPQKNQAEAVRAIAKLPPADRPLLKLIGPIATDYDAELRREADVLGVEMETTGAMPHTEALAEIAGATGLLQPSQFENSPVTVMEAMAIGTPVIATGIAGIPELIGDGRGTMYESGDTAGLAEAISQLGSRETVSKTTSAKQWITETSSSGVVAERTLRVYDEVIDLW